MMQNSHVCAMLDCFCADVTFFGGKSGIANGVIFSFSTGTRVGDDYYNLGSTFGRFYR